MSGLTPMEKSVMDLRDEGLSSTQIAARLEISTKRASTIIAMYDDSPSSDRANVRAMRNNSADFLRRLQAEGQIIVPRQRKEARHG